MIKNAKSLMDKSRNLAAAYNITANEVLQNYMFERILERLSISKYKNQFNQYIVPIYQRTYSWGEKQCQVLWE